MFEIVVWIVGGCFVFILGMLLNGSLCFHKLTEGGGGMGDGIDCEKCGLSTYYFPLLWLYTLLGRVE